MKHPPATPKYKKWIHYPAAAPPIMPVPPTSKLFSSSSPLYSFTIETLSIIFINVLTSNQIITTHDVCGNILKCYNLHNSTFFKLSYLVFLVHCCLIKKTFQYYPKTLLTSDEKFRESYNYNVSLKTPLFFLKRLCFDSILMYFLNA